MKALFIIAQEGFQPTEYGTPKKILAEAGVEVITASLKKGICRSTLGTTTAAHLSLKEVNVSDYGVIAFIGGPGAVNYQYDTEAHKIAQEAVKKNKIIAAICIAPTILAYAGVLKGKKATVWNSDGKQQAVLEKNGATYSGESVTVDGKIVTANGPKAAEEFAQKILSLF